MIHELHSHRVPRTCLWAKVNLVNEYGHMSSHTHTHTHTYIYIYIYIYILMRGSRYDDYLCRSCVTAKRMNIHGRRVIITLGYIKTLTLYSQKGSMLL